MACQLCVHPRCQVCFDIQRTATPLVVEDEPHPDAAPRPHSRPATELAAQPTKASSLAPAPHLPKIPPEQLGS